MIVQPKDKVAEYQEVGSVNMDASFLFDGNLCVFIKDDYNLASFDVHKQVGVFDLIRQQAYILPFTQKVIVVDVDPIVYTHK